MAGSGRSMQYLQLILTALKNAQRPVELIHTNHSGHAQQVVEATDLSVYSGVIAAGGDGTLFEVINGLMSHPAERRAPLGVIPVGTGNAFSRELGLQPTDWEKGIGIITGNHAQSIDIGHAQSRDQHFYFINIIGVGFVVDAGRTTLKIKKLGKSAYTLATLWETARLKKHPVKLTMEDHSGQVIHLDDEVVFVEVANSRFTGTSFLIAPEARIDDGLLDVVILNNISRLRILRLFPTIYSGKHVNYPEVETHQVKRITIHTEKPMPLMPDGEFIGHTPVTIECMTAALKMFSPSSD